MTEIASTTWFPASPDTLFGWWTDAARLARWFAPEGWRVVSSVAEPRPGGAWQVVFTGAGGRVTEQGEYLMLDRPNGLRLSLQQHFGDGSSGPRTEVSVGFHAEGAGTRMEFRQTGLTPAQAAAMVEGWESCFAQIAAGLAPKAAAG